MTADSADRCCWAGCKSKCALHYLGRPLCDKHWVAVCAYFDTGKAAHLALMLKLPLKLIAPTITFADTDVADAGIEVTL